MKQAKRCSFLWLLSAVLLASLAISGQAEEMLQLKEDFAAGYQYHVSSRVELSGNLSLPPDKGKGQEKALKVTGSSAIDYDECILNVSAQGEVEKTARIYRRVELERKVGEQAQQNTIRPSVRRLVLIRLKQIEVPFSPDGPLTWNEIDLVRTDVFTPALLGLLPDKAVRAGERWTAGNPAIQELTDLERIEEGKVDCTLEQVIELDKRRFAKISFAGTVRGVNEDGPNKQQLDGYVYFDLESRHLSYLYLKGINFLLDKEGKSQGSVEGRFVLTRQANIRQAELALETLKRVELEPTADNTMLLYDNTELGIRFLHSRRWRVAGVRGRQVALDETAGSGLMLTLDPTDKVPSGAQFQAETRTWLNQQKAKVNRTGDLTRLQVWPQSLERFDYDVELAGQKVGLTYFVISQRLGGATLAARLLPADLANMQKEIDKIAKSVFITKEIRGEGKK